MKLGDSVRNRLNSLSAMIVTLPAMALASGAFAQETVADATANTVSPAAEAPAWVPYGPDMIKGQPIPGGIGVQEQYSVIGDVASPLHHGLVWVMAIICVVVLALLIYVMIRFNKRANPVPSKTSHNTLLEVLWTGIPVLILVIIAVPSISLLSRQYESPPADAVTVKVTGYQWYWGYSYPDHGDFEVVSNMMPEEEAKEKGFPSHLEVDNRMVVPAGVPIRIQTTAADVIHSFAVPSLWFKLDAVPGRLNEKLLTIKEPGIYYGQCSELCGARHGYMPIAVEAVPLDRFKAWVASQGGEMPGEKAEEAPADAGAEASAEAAPAA